MGLKKLSVMLGCGLVCVAAVTANAEEAVEPPKVHYVELSPPLVTNYNSDQHLGYVKAAITLRVKGDDTRNAVNQHQPFIQASLVDLMSKQSFDDLSSPKKRVEVQTKAREAIVALLSQEHAATDVEDVLFTSFVLE
jgi:flagellar FliL protein